MNFMDYDDSQLPNSNHVGIMMIVNYLIQIMLTK